MIIDKKLTSAVKVGVGYQFDNSDVDGFRRDVDVDTNTAFVYTEYKPSKWFVNGVASRNWSTFKEKKKALGETFKAKYHADTYALQGLTGYEFITEYGDITPMGGLRYNHIRRHGYKDTATQVVSGKDIDVLTAVAGVKIAKDGYGIGCHLFRPEAYVGVTYDLVSDRDNAVVNLANGASYTVYGKRLNRFGVEAGVGLTAELTDKLSANINYMGGFRKDYQNHTGMIGLKYAF